MNEEHALALATPHRFVVIASPESLAWTPAFANSGDVFVLDPLRAPDADVIGPLQPPGDGPGHRAIPRWAVYDCAEVPGAVISLLRTPVSSPYSTPLDPLAVVLATPHAEPGSWHLYSITVRSAASPSGEARSHPEIRTQLVRSAMALLRAERATLVVPWTSSLIGRLSMLETVEVLAARTPLHGADPMVTLLVHGRSRPAPQPAAEPVAATPTELAALPAYLDLLEGLLEQGRHLLVQAAPVTTPGSIVDWRWTIHEARP